MHKETCTSSTSSRTTESDHKPTGHKACEAFKKLKAWQVRQYRIAVDENQWYMGERLGRNVDWQEAEKDFLLNEYYGCAPKWREEFCAGLCSHFESCKLGQHFCRSN